MTIAIPSFHEFNDTRTGETLMVTNWINFHGSQKLIICFSRECLKFQKNRKILSVIVCNLKKKDKMHMYPR